jgi:hypothetical protein
LIEPQDYFDNFSRDLGTKKQRRKVSKKRMRLFPGRKLNTV